MHILWGSFPRARRPRISVVVLLALLCAVSSAAAAPTVWVEPDWTRIGPTDPAGTAATITLYAARGEAGSFQILVRAPEGGLSQVNVTAPDLVGPGGRIIPRACLTLYREHYLHVSKSSPDGSYLDNHPLGVGWYPDALIPFVDPDTGQDLTGARFDAVPFDLAAQQNQPIWVDVSVPREATGGDYRGVFTVTSAQGEASVSLTLHVWNFALPLRPALNSCFGNDSSTDLSEITELLQNRLMPRRVSPSLERGLIDTAGLNSTNAGFWSGADWRNCAVRIPTPTVSQFQAAAALHQPDLLLYAYTADEITSCTDLFPTIREWARNMHQSRILNLITVPPVNELLDDGSGTGRSAVDIWVLLPFQFDDYADAVAYVKDKGDRVWSYNCLSQDDYSPKWLLDYAPINYRIQPGFLNQSLGLTGLLYWRIDRWTRDPWTNPLTYGGGYPGEGFLVYPGADVGLPGKVVPSMRLKYLRDGVNDYDYIELLKQRGLGGEALTVVRSLAPDWRNWTRDPAALEAARCQLAPLLEAGFSDVPTNYWAYREITACRNAGIVLGYADGTYQPKTVVKRDQMAVYIARALAGGSDAIPTGPAVATFPDVPKDNWAYNEIEYAVLRNIVKGYKEDGCYHPERVVNRGQMAVFIAHSICDPTGEEGLADYEPPTVSTFRDVHSAFWAYKYIEYLAGLHIVSGYKNGTYQPGREVTRDQMAVYIAKAFQLPLPEAAPPR